MLQWIARSTWILFAALPVTGRTAEVSAASQQPVRYDVEFFAQFSPRTAIDMIDRVPSFTLRDVDVEEERRGFSGAVGNVLVDGKRPSAKSQTLKDILQRIPATQVLYIEVLRGAETAGDSSGDTVLANVVRTRTAGAGVWSGGFEYAQQHEAAPSGYLSWAGRVGQVDYALGANSYSLKRELPATWLVRDGQGEPMQQRYETSPREYEQYAINGEASRDLAGGRLRVTGQASRSRYHQDNAVDSYSMDGLFTGDELAPYTESKRTAELGAHFEIAPAAWQYNLTVLATRSQFDGGSSFASRDGARTLEYMSDYLQSRDTGESIVRVTGARPLERGQLLQIGAEGARNTLDAHLDFRALTNGQLEPVPVQNSKLHMVENRGEAFLSHAWRGARWSTEARMAFEASTLSFSGDDTQSVDLRYWKPALLVSRSFGSAHQMRLRMSREVGQLDFADFASSVSLSDDLIEGGNPGLRPETSWQLELAADVRLQAQMACSIRLFRHWIDDVVDLVPLNGSETRIAAPGNIGEGRLYGAQLAFATPLAEWIPGGSLNVDATFQDTAVRDPLTLRQRSISSFVGNKLKADFRQDLRHQGWAWGLKYVRASSSTDYRIDESDRKRASPSLDVFIERRVLNSATLRLTAVSLLGSPELRTRVFHAGDRTAVVSTSDHIEKDPGRWFTLTLSGSF